MPGEILRDDQYINSNNGKYTLIMQRDGSLVMYRAIDGSVRYRMEKYGSYAIMQLDGNFVEYNSNGAAIWHTSTYGRCPDCWLKISDEGDLRVEYVSSNGSYGFSPWGIGNDLDYPAGDAQRYPMESALPAGPPPSTLPNPPIPPFP